MSRPKWENDALLAIMRDGVAIEDAPFVLECIRKAAERVDQHDDAEMFPLFMEYHANDKAALCNIDELTFADVLACLGHDLMRLEHLWTLKHFDPPTDEADWSLE
jgi:hypothetical protein